MGSFWQRLFDWLKSGNKSDPGPHFAPNELQEHELGGQPHGTSAEIPISDIVQAVDEMKSGGVATEVPLHELNTEELERERQLKIEQKVRVALGEDVGDSE